MSKTRILLVEDDPVSAYELRVSLSALGYSPVVVDSGEAAVEAARQQAPDIIVMDITLKGEMDGIQAGEAIHADMDVPIIYLTCHSESEVVQRAQVSKPFGFLIKPFHPLELYSTIETALYRYQSEKLLRDRERWMGGILDAMGQAIIAVNALGAVVYLNQAAQDLTGWKEVDAVGRDFPEVCSLLFPGTGEHLHQPLLELLSEKPDVPVKRTMQLSLLGAPARQVRIAAYPMSDAEGVLFGMTIMLTEGSTTTVH